MTARARRPDVAFIVFAVARAALHAVLVLVRVTQEVDAAVMIRIVCFRFGPIGKLVIVGAIAGGGAGTPVARDRTRAYRTAGRS